jgi:Tripartite tricarboxylate transporter TctB family
MDERAGTGMNLEFLERKDFWAGLSLIASGAVAIFIARNYPFGSSLRMGPGYFPIVLGAMLVLFGIGIAAKGFREGADKLTGPWLPRLLVALPILLVLCGISLHNYVYFYVAAVVVAAGAAWAIQKRKRGEALEASASSHALVILPLALVLFGFLIDRAGFIPAMLALIIGSATASNQFRLVEVLLFSVVLTTLCVVVFIWALGLPYELIVGIW